MRIQQVRDSRLLTDLVVYSLSSLFYPYAKRDNNSFEITRQKVEHEISQEISFTC